ncbi:MAG: phosphoribosylamine--glycine ligase [Propionibacteriaceae bacterium]
MGRRVLLLGNGGREHALARALVADPYVTQLFVAPGNPGTAQIATNIAVTPTDTEAVLDAARHYDIELVVIGPEAPLVAGVGDALRAAGFAVFGPDAGAAQLEGSKAFAKEVMAAAGVPTAQSHSCTTSAQADAAFAQFGAPYVVKDDALAAGKGVVVTDDLTVAKAHAAACEKVVIEEFLSGPEVSLFVITDGVHALPLMPSQDHKRAFDGDQGPNTGGMGSYNPLSWLPEGFVDEVMEQVTFPTLGELRRRGVPFVGLLYVGLVLTATGPKVIEFNARFGDPETQTVLALLDSGLGEVLDAAARGTLDTVGPLRWKPGFAVNVVVAAAGYPDGTLDHGPLTIPADTPDYYYLHAGTTMTDTGVHSSGGRVVSCVGLGATLAQARAQAYTAVAALDFPNGFHRTDIAHFAL